MLSGDGARMTRNEGKKTTDCHGTHRRGLTFGLTEHVGTHGRPTFAPPEPEFRGATMRETYADMPLVEWL